MALDANEIIVIRKLQIEALDQLAVERDSAKDDFGKYLAYAKYSNKLSTIIDHLINNNETSESINEIP